MLPCQGFIQRGVWFRGFEPHLLYSGSQGGGGGGGGGDIPLFSKRYLSYQCKTVELLFYRLVVHPYMDDNLQGVYY